MTTPHDQAQYKSIWNANVTVNTRCTVDLSTSPIRVLDVDLVDLDEYGLDDATLECEFIELADGTTIYDFDVYDGAAKPLFRIRDGDQLE